MTTNTSPPPPTSEAAPLNPMPDVEKVFKRFDSNDDGKISSSELGSMIGALGPSPSKDELGRMMAEMDTNGDGFIDLKEFAHFNSGQQGGDGDGEEAAAEEVLKEAFDMYDIDKNGLISAGELNMVLKKLGEKCSVEDCSRMITSVDSDGDGNVNFHEFKKMMSNSKASPV